MVECIRVDKETLTKNVKNWQKSGMCEKPAKKKNGGSSYLKDFKRENIKEFTTISQQMKEP